MYEDGELPPARVAEAEIAADAAVAIAQVQAEAATEQTAIVAEASTEASEASEDDELWLRVEGCEAGLESQSRQSAEQNLRLNSLEAELQRQQTGLEQVQAALADLAAAIRAAAMTEAPPPQAPENPSAPSSQTASEAPTETAPAPASETTEAPVRKKRGLRFI